MKLLKISALIAALAAPAFAHDYKLGALSIEHPFGFTAPATAMASGGFMEIANTGSEDDRLIAVEADFNKVELHTHEIDANGVARMVELKGGIPLPAGETVMLKPGGLHVMFMGLGGKALEEGETVEAVLVFEKAGRLPVSFNIEARGAGMGHDHGNHGHDHSHHGHDAHATSDKK